MWKEASFNDAKWSDAVVPGYWESVPDFRDYDGFGWYRVRFRVPEDLAGQRLILLLGKIDDVDEAYVNGERVGRTGRIWKRMERSDLGEEWLQLRAYTLPTDLLNQNKENVLAVRVYDTFMHGGIYDGPVGLISRERYQKWKQQSNPVRNLFDWLFR
jgi:sialate O-acetylesterase